MKTAYRRYPERSDILLSLAAVPLYLASTGRYGLRMLAALAVSAAVGYLTETIGAQVRGKGTGILGYPAWLLFPLVLPPAFPLWMLAASACFAVLVGVVFFGGHGRQLAAPVALCWAFAALSYPAAFGFGWAYPFPGPLDGFAAWSAAVPTIDHPIAYLLDRAGVPVRLILAGDFPQAPGNALPALTIACGIALWLLRAVDVRGSVSFLATVAALTAVFHRLLPGAVPPPQSLLVGNLLTAAFFIYPDTRVSPRTRPGRVFAGILAGVIAFIIRAFSDFSCGVFFAVLFGNVFSPIIDEWMLHVRYGREPA